MPQMAKSFSGAVGFQVFPSALCSQATILLSKPGRGDSSQRLPDPRPLATGYGHVGVRPQAASWGWGVVDLMVLSRSSHSHPPPLPPGHACNFPLHWCNLAQVTCFWPMGG